MSSNIEHTLLPGINAQAHNPGDLRLRQTFRIHDGSSIQGAFRITRTCLNSRTSAPSQQIMKIHYIPNENQDNEELE